jgi:hypothetical protein
MQLERKQSNPKFVKATLDHPQIKALESQWPEKIAILKQLWDSGEVAVIEYSENPRTDEATGRTYPNRYFEGTKTRDELAPEPEPELDIPVEGAAVTPASSSEEIPMETTRGEDPVKAWRISLAAGAKLAIATLPYLEEHERSVDEQKTLAMFWGLFLFNTTQETARAAIGDFAAVAGDDIPF